MSAETDIEKLPKEEPKSKRLSSLVWILVLWGGARGCSEMDGISWTRVFWIEASSWGAIPASILLLCTLIFPFRYQATLRWAALGAVILGFCGALILGGYFHENTTPAETNYFFVRQIIYPLLVIGWLALKQLKEKNND